MSGPRPQKSILVCALPRSGSSFFCEALAATWKAGRLDEWLNTEGIPAQKRAKYRPYERELKAYFADVQASEQTSNGVFGIKLMLSNLDTLPQLSERANSTPLEAIREVFPRPYFIRIHRRNRLKQAVSFAKALQSNKWSNTQKDKRLDADALFFSYSSIFKYLQTIDREETAWAAFFKKNKIPSLEVCYEEFIKDYEGTVARVFEYCGIELAERVDPSKNIHTKMADNINATWYKQFEALQRKLENGTGMASVSDSKIGCALEFADIPSSADAGSKARCRVKVLNTGVDTLEPYGHLDGSDWLYIKYAWVDAEGSALIDKEARYYGLDATPLDTSLAPSDAVEMELVVSMPKAPGRYLLNVYLARGSSHSSLGARPNEEIVILASDPCSKAAVYFGTPPNDSGEGINGWFGKVDMSEFPKVVHEKLGTVWCSGPGASEDSYFFNAPSFGWIWTNSKQYPLFKLMDEERWIRLPELVDELKESRLKAQK